MRARYILLCAWLLSAVPAFSQSRSHRLDLGAGIHFERGLTATLAYEHEMRHHAAFEVFTEFFLKWEDCPSCGHVCPESFWHSYNTVSAGVVWKPCVLRRKNSWGNLRLGGSGGSDTDRFVGGVLVGYERNYALPSGCILYWQVRTDFMIGGRDLFRPGLVLGLKFPIYKNAL